MNLIKVESKRCNSHGEKYIDFYLTWTHDNKNYRVRVVPAFPHEYKLLYSEAQPCPSANGTKK